MSVAIVTDSCSDLSPEQLREYDIVSVPLTVFFGNEGLLSPDELPPEAFWQRVTAPDAPFPHTAAPSAGQFKAAYEKLFAQGADEIVYVGMSETLSTTINSGRMAAEMMPGKTILTVDARSACMGTGAMALRASQLAKAVVGGLLSIKPIIRVIDGEVIVHEQVRTRSKATERIIELLTPKPVKWLHVLYAPPVDHEAFRDAILARLPGPPPELVTTQIIGPVIGTHVGPGAYGAVLVEEP